MNSRLSSVWFALSMFALFGVYFWLNGLFLSTPSQPVALPPPPSHHASWPQAVQVSPGENTLISTDVLALSFLSQGGCLGSNTLLQDSVSYNDPTAVAVITSHGLCKAYGVRVGAVDLRNQPAVLERLSAQAVRITQRTEQFQIVRTFHFPENEYLGDMQLEIVNLSNQTVSEVVGLEIGGTSDDKNAGGWFSGNWQHHQLGYRLMDGTLEFTGTPFDEAPTPEVIVSVSGARFQWIDTSSLYFANVLVPQFNTPLDLSLIRTGYNLRRSLMSEIDQTVYEAWVGYPVTLAPEGRITFAHKIYIGPKSEVILGQYPELHLTETIDFGFFRIIAKPIYHILAFIDRGVNNWGVAIIVLTILINLIFLPLQIRAYASAQKMQKIQPELKKIQAKYKDDKVSLQQETMKLMSSQGVNPLSGCLPLLPQIPVFFGLDSALRYTFELRQAPFFGWIHDLSLHDPYFILPILVAGLMVVFLRMIPMPSMDPTQAKIIQFLPLIFAVFMVFYPSGLALYVITNTLVSMIRQFFLTRHGNKNKKDLVLSDEGNVK